jgi:acetate kinase
VVFSGGIGEHSPEVRARICAGMEWIGLVVDSELNAAAVGGAGRLSPPGARLPAYTIPADEERIIAQDTLARVAANRASPSAAKPSGSKR